jgi:hypothetical protein
MPRPVLRPRTWVWYSHWTEPIENKDTMRILKDKWNHEGSYVPID